MAGLGARSMGLPGLDSGADEAALPDAFREPGSRDYMPTRACREAEANVLGALRDGHITPAARDWALRLDTLDPASLESCPATKPAPYRH